MKELLLKYLVSKAKESTTFSMSIGSDFEGSCLGLEQGLWPTLGKLGYDLFVEIHSFIQILLIFTQGAYFFFLLT